MLEACGVTIAVPSERIDRLVEVHNNTQKTLAVTYSCDGGQSWRAATISA